MKVIEDSNQGLLFDIVTFTYPTGMNHELKVKNFFQYENEEDFITLDDIVTIAELDGYNSGVITVMVENPLEGYIYRYSNYEDDVWYQIGTTCGYA